MVPGELDSWVPDNWARTVGPGAQLESWARLESGALGPSGPGSDLPRTRWAGSAVQYLVLNKTVYGYLSFNNIEMFSFSVLMLSTSLLHFWRVVELPNWVISYWL